MLCCSQVKCMLNTFEWFKKKKLNKGEVHEACKTFQYML